MQGSGFNSLILQKWQQEKTKAWSWKTAHSKPYCFKLPTESSFSANLPRPHRPQPLIDSFHRQCIYANLHPASVRRSKGHLRHLWPGSPVQQLPVILDKLRFRPGFLRNIEISLPICRKALTIICLGKRRKNRSVEYQCHAGRLRRVPFGLRGIEIGPKIWTTDLSFIASQFCIIGAPQGKNR